MRGFYLPSLLTALFAGCSTTPDDADDAPLFAAGDDNERALAESLATEHLERVAGDWGLASAADFHVSRVRIDELLTAHVRFQQTFEDVPVFGGETIVHLDAWGAVTSLTDNVAPRVQVDTTPDFLDDDAIEIAVDAAGGWERASEDPDATLWILRHEGVDHLAWRVEVKQLDGTTTPASPVVFVDAHTGEVVWSYDNLQTGTGTAYYSGSVGVNSYYSSSSYYMEDTTRKLGTYTFANTTSSLYYLTDSDDAWTSDSTAVQAHFNAATVWDYYSGTFGRNGIDGAGGPGYISSLTGSGTVISSFIHYSRNYVNAYWGGSYMVYGDGDGVWAGPMVTMDITGHEMTHGVTQYEANLTYSGESGGLNEAVSDIFGALVERYADGNVTSSATWYIGEDTWTPGTSGDALRYMNNPTADGYSLDYYTSSAGSTDVHYSSGIANLAFYLLSEGGAHPRLGGTAMTGVGADKAAQIWYRALSTYMTSSTSFSGARTATLSAASDLYGASSAEYTAVGDAWTLVGVSGTTTTGCGSYTYTATGSLSRSGKSYYEPGGSYYTTSASGTHAAALSGPSTANFDLYLQLYNSKKKSWSNVATGTTSSSTETVSYSGSSGNYRWQVYSKSGSGSYTLCYSHP